MSTINNEGLRTIYGVVLPPTKADLYGYIKQGTLHNNNLAHTMCCFDFRSSQELLSLVEEGPKTMVFIHLDLGPPRRI